MPYKDSERQQRWRAKNRDKIRTQNRAAQHRYRADNPEKVRERTRNAVRRWRKENPDKVRAYKAIQRAHKRGATVGDPTAIAAREAEIRESRWCVSCEAEVDDLHVDHIQPLSKGGAHSAENLQGLCARHNLEKGAKLSMPRIKYDKGED